MGAHATTVGYPVSLIKEAGDSALLILFGDAITMRINDAALAFAERLCRLAPEGVIFVLPTMRSVLVSFDPLRIESARLRERCERLLDSAEGEGEGPSSRRLWRIPAVYGGRDGPDLPALASLTGMREDQLVAEHAACQLRVMMLGFAPGLAYLGLLPGNWQIPRLKTINPSAPAGSVAVAIRQSVFFATAAPTGWRIIARSPFRNFDPGQDPPCMLRPGDCVQFEPVRPSQAARWTMAAAKAEKIP